MWGALFGMAFSPLFLEDTPGCCLDDCWNGSNSSSSVDTSSVSPERVESAVVSVDVALLLANPGNRDRPETLDGSNAEINVPAIAPNPMPKISSLAPYTKGDVALCLWGNAWGLVVAVK